MQYAVTGTFGRLLENGFSLHLSGGALLGGTIVSNGESSDFGTGFVVSVRGAKQLLDQKGAVPFVLLSLSISFSMNKVLEDEISGINWISSDARLALTTGYTLFNTWQLYLSPKVFGGPVFYETKSGFIRGRDKYFVQLGIGTAFLLPLGISIYAEGSLLNEQAIAAGVSISF